MPDLISRIARLIVQDNAVLLVGDRLRRDDIEISVLDQIAVTLAERIDYQRTDLRLQSVARDFEVLKGRSELIQAIQSILDEIEFQSDEYQQLLADAVMPHTKIITTRFDQSLEGALRNYGKSFVQIVRDTDIPSFDETRVTVIKIHGDISRPDSLVVTEDDMDAFIDNLPTVSDVIRAFFATKTLVFLGYDLNDEVFKRSFRQVARNVVAFQRPAYAVVSAPLDEIESKYWERQNVQIIVQESLAFLDDLSREIKKSIKDESVNVAHPLDKLAKPALPSHPYKALQSFGEQDAAVFFGRKEESQRLANRILAHRLTVLYGESGSGKTSLLRAGTGPLLAKQHALVSIASPVPGGKLQDELLQSLVVTCERLGLQTPDHSELIALIRYQANMMEGPIVLVVDQFEQFFLVQDASRYHDHAAFLGELILDRSLDVRVVLVIREDFLGQLQILDGVVPGLLDTRFRLHKLDREAARAAIEEPAIAFGASWEDSLVQRLLDDLYEQAGGGISPPQLQIVCDQLYRRAKSYAGSRKAVHISSELFQLLGGTQTILGDYLEQAVASFTPDTQADVKRLLGVLVSSSRVKQRLTLQALVRAAEVDQANAEHILDELTNQRLLQRYGSADHDGYSYELTHDYLAARIALWLGDEFWAEQKVREILRHAVPEWLERSRLLAPDDLLLVTAQRDRVRFDDVELALVYASAVAYDQHADEWIDALEDAEHSEILFGLLGHDQPAARLHAVEQLNWLSDEDVGELLADIALKDHDSSVREAAAKAIAQGRHCQAVDKIAKYWDDPQLHAHVRNALVKIGDLEPECKKELKPPLHGIIRRQVWAHRWQRNQGQILRATLRAAQGGLAGLGLGMGLFLGLSDLVASGFELEQILSQWRLVVSLGSVGIPIAGILGALVGASSAFVNALLTGLSDRARLWRNWGFATLTGALVMGFGMVVLANIFAGEARLMQSFSAGLMIGAVVVGACMVPLRIQSLLRWLIAVVGGMLVFLGAWALGWLFSPNSLWLAVMGFVAGLGFYWGLRADNNRYK